MAKMEAYELRNRYPGGVIPEDVAIYYQSTPTSTKIRVLGWEDAPIGAYITLIMDDPVLNRRMIIQAKEVEIIG